MIRKRLLDTMKIRRYAIVLQLAHGAGAQAEASRTAEQFENSGQIAEAANWRAVEREIISMCA